MNKSICNTCDNFHTLLCTPKILFPAIWFNKYFIYQLEQPILWIRKDVRLLVGSDTINFFPLVSVSRLNRAEYLLRPRISAHQPAPPLKNFTYVSTIRAIFYFLSRNIKRLSERMVENFPYRHLRGNVFAQVSVSYLSQDLEIVHSTDYIGNLRPRAPWDPCNFIVFEWACFFFQHETTFVKKENIYDVRVGELCGSKKRRLKKGWT